MNIEGRAVDAAAAGGGMNIEGRAKKSRTRLGEETNAAGVKFRR